MPTSITAQPRICREMPILRRNDQQTAASESVKLLQRRLNDYGFQIAVDGFFGPETEVAVRHFQTKRYALSSQFPVDGFVGPQTWHALGVCIVIPVGC